MSSSTYDDLHDKYFNILSNKTGTKYERLTAFVFKKLNESDTVIHDLKLIGETDVKHQIDVIIKNNNKEKRIIIECKDFDISRDKVGLGIVRNFWGVIDDINPDEAMIVTCNGFTREAKKYAKGKGIRLVVLRQFEEKDWDNRIQKVESNMKIYYPSEPKVEFVVDKTNNKNNTKSLNNLVIDRSTSVYLNTNKKHILLLDFIQEKRDENSKMEIGKIEKSINLEKANIEFENTKIPIKGINIKFQMKLSERFLEIKSNKIAKLIMKDLSGKDMIIFGKDLKNLKIDNNTGKVVNT